MRRNILFSFRINEEEKRLLQLIANKLYRTKSDLLRYLLIKENERINERRNNTNQ